MEKLSQKNGFTLVELMTVVAIIGVLVSSALPNYISAKERTIQNACIANLRQIERIMNLYYIDNGRWPDDVDDLDPYFIDGAPTVCPGGTATYRFIEIANGSEPPVAYCPIHEPPPHLGDI